MSTTECPKCHGRGHYIDADGKRIDPCTVCKGYGHIEDEPNFNEE